MQGLSRDCFRLVARSYINAFIENQFYWKKARFKKDVNNVAAILEKIRCFCSLNEDEVLLNSFYVHVRRTSAKIININGYSGSTMHPIANGLQLSKASPRSTTRNSWRARNGLKLNHAVSKRISADPFLPIRSSTKKFHVHLSTMLLIFPENLRYTTCVIKVRQVLSGAN